jgi:hypothetical protein
MFTTEEKANALKYANGIVQFTTGIGGIAGLCETRGHDLRSEIIDALDGAVSVWDEATAWFAGLSGTLGGNRSMVLAESRIHYDNMILDLAALVYPDASIAAKFAAARTAFDGFDWSLPYADPRHQLIPGVPFQFDKTVVGPHGDWTKAVAIMHHTAIGISQTLKTFIEVYRTVPIYPEIANHALQEQLSRFAMMMQQCARVWSMHIEVEADIDRMRIDFDLSKSPTTRGRAFLRTLRQTEILFTYDMAKGKNFAGRGFELGLIGELRTLYFQEFIVPLGRANGPEWTKDLVVGDGNGGLFRFHAELTDFWQLLDSWIQAAYGFYHPVPDRTKWEVEHAKVVDPQDVRVIPTGFFDEDEASIAAVTNEVALVSDKLVEILATLRDKEGSSI